MLRARPNPAFNLVSAHPTPPLDLATLGLPAYLVPSPANSTPRQRRQWQRAQARNLALSGVQPQKIKHSSVASAPGVTAVNGMSTPVATAPHAAATDARKAGKGHGASAVGPGAVASNKSGGIPWWAFLLVAVAGAVGWETLSHHLQLLQYLPWRTRT